MSEQIDGIGAGGVEAGRDAVVDRRGLLAAAGGLGLGLAASASGAGLGGGRAGVLGVAGSILSAQDLGFDEASGEYTLPALPYAYNALEPHIDEQTMRIHHDRHHAGYVNGLNKALAALKEIRLGSGDAGLIQHWSRQLSFHGGGHVNHTLFWRNMRPGEMTEPKGPLLRQMESDFGSYSQFLLHFKAASAAVEGSGWGWLVWEPVGSQLMVLQMQNQQQMLFTGVVPLLGVDVWEHAYYLKYQNRRMAYIEAFCRVIDWDEVARRFESAKGSA